MKGIIFNAAHHAVTTLFDEDTWDDLLEQANLEGAYTSVGTYNDDELNAIVGAAIELTGLDADALLSTLGQHAFGHLANTHVELISPYGDLREFLDALDSIIHPEVMKIHPDANPPRFTCSTMPDGSIQMVYESERNLSALAEGLVLGAAAHYEQPLRVTRSVDTDVDGSGTRAVLHLHFLGAESEVANQ